MKEKDFKNKEVENSFVPNLTIKGKKYYLTGVELPDEVTDDMSAVKFLTNLVWAKFETDRGTFLFDIKSDADCDCIQTLVTATSYKIFDENIFKDIAEDDVIDLDSRIASRIVGTFFVNIIMGHEFQGWYKETDWGKDLVCPAIVRVA